MQKQAPPACRKILVCITEDWFALTHFRGLLATLTGIAEEVVVATRSSGRLGEIEALGCRTIDFDFQRSSLNALRQAAAIDKLARLIRTERPDAVHAIAMQMLVMTSLALWLIPHVPHVVLHLTGLGFLGISNTRAARLVRPLAMSEIARVLRRPTSWLIAENPEDVEFLRSGGVQAGTRVTVLGGAGIDAEAFPPLPPPHNRVPAAAFVGRMIRSKGLEVLVEAARRLSRRGVRLDVSLYGKTDDDNPEGVAIEQLKAWHGDGHVNWHGYVSDIGEIWRRSDIAVLPAITREGMPRAVLEAAASARPLIVTDVPGCRHFVRHGIEGLVVPPGNADALADALAELALDANLRSRLGAAARQRVLEGFTIEQVAAATREAYQRLFLSSGAPSD
jgi:glycosyltransferase involved in cell wall biosynthesis